MKITSASVKFVLIFTISGISFITALEGSVGQFGGGIKGISITVLIIAALVLAGVVSYNRLQKHPIALKRSADANTFGAQQYYETKSSNTGLKIENTNAESKKNEEEVLIDKSFVIQGGDLFTIPLNVYKGDNIRGRVEEADGQDFDWYVLDEHNVVLAKRKETFEYLVSGTGDWAYAVKCVMRRNDAWFLVIDLYGKSNSRKVAVTLRKSSNSKK